MVFIFSGKSKQDCKNYLDAVECCGLKARIVNSEDFDSPASLREDLGRSKGIILSGGGDINPVLQGISPSKSHWAVSGVETDRDLLEKEAVVIALNMNIPLFAICRGFQVLNWVLGGTLYQHLSEDLPNRGKSIEHQQKNLNISPEKPSHFVFLESNSLVKTILGEEHIFVNSTHHQGIKDVASCLSVSGRSEDGLPEVLEMPYRKNLLAVQFHPEKMWRSDECMAALFKWFGACVNSPAEVKN